MTNQEILDNAPEGASVSDITGQYFDEYNNHLNSRGFWSEKDTSPISPRSLADIARIAELEKERDKLHKQVMVLTHTKEFDYVDDPQFVTNFNNIDIAFQVHSLEQQAIGIEDVVNECAHSMEATQVYVADLDCRVADLREQAKALKEQGE